MKIQIDKNGLEIKWGFSFIKPEYRKSGNEPYYLGIGLTSKKDRAAWTKEGWSNIKLIKFWYDTIHANLRLYFIDIYWSTPWTTTPKDFWK